MNLKSTLLAGTLFGLLGVVLGAFGAHAFKPMLLETNRFETFELAVRYQFYHSLAIFITGILQFIAGSQFFRYASIAFVFGILLFSGSLYILSFTGNAGVAMATPVGGIFLIAGWILIGSGIIKNVK